jgi:hypothetical protein
MKWRTDQRSGAHLGIVGDLPKFGGHLVEVLADVPVPAPVQLSLVLDQAQPQVVRPALSCHIELFQRDIVTRFYPFSCLI